MYNEEKNKHELLSYFNQDAFAAETWRNKYALKDRSGKLLETTPDDMHRRMAKEFARIEQNYEEVTKKFNKETLSEENIYNLFSHFKYIIPAGSVMANLGNPYNLSSLSNCFVIGQPQDSIESIMSYRTQQAQLMKRRGGVGKDLSLLRPKGSLVNNSALTSTGAVSFMNVDSEITIEIAQGGRRKLSYKYIQIYLVFK